MAYPPLDLNKCPRCKETGKQIPAGTSKKTGRPYSAFYVCDSTNPCQENGRNLSWKSAKQYVYLSNN